MTIVRWEPIRDLVASQGRLNRLFNETFPPWFDEGWSGSGTWTPAVDIYETDQNVVLKAELPGVDPKDIEARVEDGTLYLKGQRKFEKEVKEENCYRLERAHGSFMRSFSLPSSINPDQVEAEYNNGVLTLTMPKREDAKPKTIKINVSRK